MAVRLTPLLRRGQLPREAASLCQYVRWGQRGCRPGPGQDSGVRHTVTGRPGGRPGEGAGAGAGAGRQRRTLGWTTNPTNWYPGSNTCTVAKHSSLTNQPGWTLVTEPEEPVTQEKVDQVLVAANSKSPEQLYTYQHVTKALAKAITQRRQRNGSFTSLKDLLTVAGMDEERLEKIASSIASNHLKSSKQFPSRILTSGLVNPRLKLTQVPSSIVAIHVQLPNVVWLQLTSDLEVVEWDSASLLGDKGSLHFDPPGYQKKIWTVTRQIPSSDLYIMEELPLRVNSSQILHTLNRTYVDATLTTFLNSRRLQLLPPGGQETANDDIMSPDGAQVSRDLLPAMDCGNVFVNSVYKLKPRVVSEYFSLSVGGERISSEQVLSSIWRGDCEAASGVHVAPDLWRNVWSLRGKEREQRTQALLIATAFFKLAILKEPQLQVTQDSQS